MPFAQGVKQWSMAPELPHLTLAACRLLVSQFDGDRLTPFIDRVVDTGDLQSLIHLKQAILDSPEHTKNRELKFCPWRWLGHQDAEKAAFAKEWLHDMGVTPGFIANHLHQFAFSFVHKPEVDGPSYAFQLLSHAQRELPHRPEDRPLMDALVVKYIEQAKATSADTFRMALPTFNVSIAHLDPTYPTVEDNDRTKNLLSVLSKHLCELTPLLLQETMNALGPHAFDLSVEQTLDALPNLPFDTRNWVGLCYLGGMQALNTSVLQRMLAMEPPISDDMLKQDGGNLNLDTSLPCYLMTMAHYGDEETVSESRVQLGAMLRSGVDVNRRFDFIVNNAIVKGPLLHMAIAQGDADSVKFLLDHGLDRHAVARVNYKGSENEPSHLLSAHNLAQALIDAHGKPEHRNVLALLQACEAKDSVQDVMQRLTASSP